MFYTQLCYTVRKEARYSLKSLLCTPVYCLSQPMTPDKAIPIYTHPQGLHRGLGAASVPTLLEEGFSEEITSVDRTSEGYVLCS